MLISDAFAQTASTAPDQSGSMINIIIMIMMFVVLWFLMIRPQMKRAKEHQKMVSELAKGDEVVTQGGIVGRITKIGENYVTVEVAEGKDGPVEVTLQKQAIGAQLPKGTLKTL
jgi:preprotein translocase subunit YajC